MIMRSIGVSIVIGLFSVVFLTAATSPFVGTWEGQMNDLPGVDLTINEIAGEISGVIGFYSQMRGTDGKWQVEGDNYTQPLLSAKVEGRNLAFEFAHHKSHDSPEFGPNVKFHMELVGPNEARLYRGDDRASIKLIRR